MEESPQSRLRSYFDEESARPLGDVRITSNHLAADVSHGQRLAADNLLDKA